jgi:hypothetical protein
LRRTRLLKLGTPSVWRNGLSARNSDEKVWSSLVRRLNDVPMSAKSAAERIRETMGMRYSKFPKICVSPPRKRASRCARRRLLAPPAPVKVPRPMSWSRNVCGRFATSATAPVGVAETATPREERKKSSGTSGLIERVE